LSFLSLLHVSPPALSLSLHRDSLSSVRRCCRHAAGTVGVSLTGGVVLVVDCFCRYRAYSPAALLLLLSPSLPSLTLVHAAGYGG
ncbi:hypothetical protein SOVF_151190, partial [Spinacia oleracea]